MAWIVGLILVFVFVTKGVFPGVQPFLKIGNAVEMDWRDIIALLIVGVVIYLIATGQIDGEDVLKILGAILIGKAISR